MNAKQVIDEILQRDWTEADLRLAADLLAEFEASPEVRQAVRNVEQLRDLLKNPSPDAEPTGGWDAFERRLLKPFPSAGAAQGNGVRLWSRWIAPAALAAALALALSAWIQIWRMNSAPAPFAGNRTAVLSTPAFTQMSPTEVTQQAGLFDHVSEVFDERAKWVAVSDGAAEMGLVSNPLPVTHQLLLLRLAVMRNGTLLSRSDIAIIAGQEADLTLPFENGQKLRYRVSVVGGAPPRLSLWVEVKKPGSANTTLAALSTELAVQSGKSVRAGDLTTTSGEYQFQLGVFEAPQVSRP